MRNEGHSLCKAQRAVVRDGCRASHCGQKGRQRLRTIDIVIDDQDPKL